MLRLLLLLARERGQVRHAGRVVVRAEAVFIARVRRAPPRKAVTAGSA